MAAEKLQKMTDELEKLTVLELAEWIKILEEKFGVQANMPLVASSAVSATTTGAPAAQQEEKTIFTVVLTNAGANKIAVIKEVRAMTNLGLKEAKDLVDAAPKSIKEGVAKEEAEDLKKRLEAAGATVELK